VILEAMISELPVISTKVGGIPYQVSSECGILIDPNSPRSLASAMDDIVKSPLKMLEMGKNSKKRVIDKFTWKKSANIAIKEYSDILASK
jgi:glycosyltransferase involved in cell wall biosynthesis